MAGTLHLAADGLYFNEAIGLPPLSASDRAAFLKRLAAMSRAGGMDAPARKAPENPAKAGKLRGAKVRG